MIYYMNLRTTGGKKDMAGIILMAVRITPRRICYGKNKIPQVILVNPCVRTFMTQRSRWHDSRVAKMGYVLKSAFTPG